MENRIFLDTETSGLKPGQVGQLSYIIEIPNQRVYAKNFFFAIDSLDDGAAEVTQRDLDFYKRASNGKVFKDYIEEIATDLNGAVLYAHNAKFDRGFMDAEFRRCGLIYSPAGVECTMLKFRNILRLPGRYGFKNPKLEEVINHYHITSRAILELQKRLYGGDSGAFHDSRYDTTAMYAAVLMDRAESKSGDVADRLKKFLTT